jgi:hypothetical protein
MRLKGVKKSEGRAYKQKQKAGVFWLGLALVAASRTWPTAYQTQTK